MQKFQTEVNQLLHLIIHSYIHKIKKIFLREFSLSNLSDALDKLKFKFNK